MMPSKYKFYHTSLGQDCENIRVASWTLKKKEIKGQFVVIKMINLLSICEHKVPK